MSLKSIFKPILPSSSKKLAQKLLLGYHSYAPSFSSAGEDMILRHILGTDMRDGFYVDVGAYHPINSSNTYFFYLQGWRGINIDARPGGMAEFQKLRPRDINLEFGVSNEKGILPFYVVKDAPSINSFSKEFLAEVGMLDHVLVEIEIPVLTLKEILDNHLPENQPIDFLTVDVEGFDLKVLMSNDWSKYRPRLIVVEDLRRASGCSELLTFLAAQDYEVCVQNAIIVDKIDEFILMDKRKR